MANNENTKSKEKFTDNSLNNQRQKLINWFFDRVCITTPEAREKLDIMHPAGRIRELKARGYAIVTLWDSWTSEHGIKHRIARYVLVQKKPLEAVKNSEVAK